MANEPEGSLAAKATPLDPIARKYARLGWLVAVLGGLAGALSFEPVAWRALIPLTPLGIFLAIRWAPSPRGAFLRVLAGGWVYYFGSLIWLTEIRNFAPIPILAAFSIVLLGLYLALYPALIGLILRRWLWSDHPAIQFFMFASLWLFAEWFRTLGKLAMPLSQLGHAWATVPLLIQISEWTGELGVSLEILWTAGMILSFAFSVAYSIKFHKFGQQFSQPTKNGLIEISENFRRSKNYGWRYFLLFGLIAVITAHMSGRMRGVLDYWAANTNLQNQSLNAPMINVALLQPNIPQKEKFESYANEDANVRAALAEGMTTKIEAMIDKNAKPDWDLLVLPESSFTEPDFFHNETIRRRVGAMARRAGADMLMSADRFVRDEPLELYNSAYLVHEDGTIDAKVYDKMRLVPFAENLPYFDIIPGFQQGIVGAAGSFSEGKEPTIFTTHDLRFGVMICFESTFSQAGRAIVRRGADFIVAVTNDAWYGLSAGPARHHHLSLLRAVETRRWIARCANTGISSIIAPSGRIVATLGLGKQGIVEGTIAPSPGAGLTWFVRHGNIWLLLPALFVFIFSARRFLKSNKLDKIVNEREK